MAMKENSAKVLNYLKEIGDAQVTSADVAEALGLEKKSVDGIFTSAIQKKGYEIVKYCPGVKNIQDLKYGVILNKDAFFCPT